MNTPSIPADVRERLDLLAPEYASQYSHLPNPDLIAIAFKCGALAGWAEAQKLKDDVKPSINFGRRVEIAPLPDKPMSVEDYIKLIIELKRELTAAQAEADSYRHNFMIQETTLTAAQAEIRQLTFEKELAEKAYDCSGNREIALQEKLTAAQAENILCLQSLSKMQDELAEAQALHQRRDEYTKIMIADYDAEIERLRCIVSGKTFDDENLKLRAEIERLNADNIVRLADAHQYSKQRDLYKTELSEVIKGVEIFVRNPVYTSQLAIGLWKNILKRNKEKLREVEGER